MKFNERKQILRPVVPFLAFCRANRKTVALICIGILLIALLDFISYLEQSSRYIKDSKGNVTALRLEKGTEEQPVTFFLALEGRRAGMKAETELQLTFGQQGEIQRENSSPEETAEKVMQAVLKDAARQAESQEIENGIIFLPKRLADGTSLTWNSSQSASVAAILMLLPLALGFLYQSQKEKEKAAEKRKQDDIRRQLPGFNNQLLLLLESGLIFNDAFNRITEGYKQQKHCGYLTQTIEAIAKEAEETGSNLVTVLGRHSKKLGVREFSRLANIITDNQHKGVNLTDKLESESEILWTARKKAAEEKGRTAETKLAFPLAVLLLVLILITAAPAVLQI